jgi:xanthine dehydrogenase accessory factor
MTLDVLREALRLTETGEPIGLATLVATRGSTPQKLGARLLAAAGRRVAGTLGGGAVEAESVQEATRTASGGAPGLREYTLSSGLDDWGLACAGTMLVFSERLDRRAHGWLTRAIRALEGRDPVAAVVVLDGTAAGSRVLVSDAEATGTFGDPALDAAAVAVGRRVLESEAPELADSGGIRLYAEPFGPPPALIVLGAGHVGKALTSLAHGLGVAVTVVDDRAEYATPERFPEADRVAVAPVGEALGWLPIGVKTAIVVAMRNHDLDYDATAVALRTPARYVGLVGSRRKAVMIAERLVASGLPVERVRELRAPIGLDLGARAPAEIALSILAEWLMVRQGGTGSAMRLHDQLFEKAAGRGAST